MVISADTIYGEMLFNNQIFKVKLRGRLSLVSRLYQMLNYKADVLVWSLSSLK